MLFEEHKRVKNMARKEAELTLGSQEVTGLLASGDRTVDMALEKVVGCLTKVVVGLDVLLDSLTAVGT